MASQSSATAVGEAASSSSSASSSATPTKAKRASASPAKRTPKRQTRALNAETPVSERVAPPTAAAAAAAAAATSSESNTVMAYMFLTNGDMAEVRSRSTRVEHLVEQLFKPKLSDLRKDNAPVSHISVQYMELPDRWLLVLDEDGMYTQPFNVGFGSFCGNFLAQMYGRILLVRTTKQGGTKAEPLSALPPAPQNDDTDDSEAYEARLERLAEIVAPFRKAYMQYERNQVKLMQDVKQMGLSVIYTSM